MTYIQQIFIRHAVTTYPSPLCYHSCYCHHVSLPAADFLAQHTFTYVHAIIRCMCAQVHTRCKCIPGAIQFHIAMSIGWKWRAWWSLLLKGGPGASCLQLQVLLGVLSSCWPSLYIVITRGRLIRIQRFLCIIYVINCECTLFPIGC